MLRQELPGEFEKEQGGQWGRVRKEKGRGG